ncbi:MAG: hypothetical protein RJA61_460 [Candidatus Parcubacteria bacterium]|jgi:murein DD-endopeptidase MepM/ murein hydrolase activator NlpD
MKKLSLQLVFLLCFTAPCAVFGATINELQTKIQDRNSQIETLEKEIEQYQKDIQTTSKQAQSLQNTIKTLDISRNKLNTDIKVTENKVDATNFTIERLALEIQNKQEGIGENLDAIKNTLRNIQRADDSSLIETMLQYGNIATFWNEIETLEQFQKSIRTKIKDLENLKQDLESKKNETELQKKKLVNLTVQLADQKKIVEANQKEKNTVLAQTKNQESTYKKILAEKEKIRDAFAQELRAFEAELKIVIDPSSIPPAGKGLLAWPLDSILVTQRFGHTDFSKTVSVYNGNGHNGVDFRAAVGTRVKTSFSGTVEGTGDTDATCPGASYGKWVLVKHPNGLSTLYAHLSLIKVSTGDQVTTGDVLGYSGNTGYSTGPHLHFTVFASQGVRIMQRQSKVCGGAYTMPVADLKAYLDPLIYL